MQAKIWLFLPKHTPILRAEKREDGQQSWQLQSVQWFPNGNNREKMAQFCSLQLSPEREGIKTWGACTYQFFWRAKLTLVNVKTMYTTKMATKNAFQWHPIVWYAGKDLFVFTKTHTYFLRAEKRERQQGWHNCYLCSDFPMEQQGENGPVL